MNEGASGSKGVRKIRLVILTLLKKLEVLKMLLIAWAVRSVVLYYFLDSLYKHFSFLNAVHDGMNVS